MILPERKMNELIYEEKVFTEKNEIQSVSLIDEKIVTIYLNSEEILTVI